MDFYLSTEAVATAAREAHVGAHRLLDYLRAKGQVMVYGTKRHRALTTDIQAALAVLVPTGRAGSRYVRGPLKKKKRRKRRKRLDGGRQRQ